MAIPIKLRRMLRQVLRDYAPVRVMFPALMGDGRGNITVDGRPGYVYVRVGNETRPAQALNQCVPNRNNLSIVVGYTSEQPDLFQILSLREVYVGSGYDLVPQVPPHHQSHEFKNVAGGDDTIWVEKQQVKPLLARPTVPESMQVWVERDFYPWDVGWNWFPGGLSPDLTAHCPAAGFGLFVLVYIDGATNTLQIVVGAPFPTFPPVSPGVAIPDAPTGSVPAVAVYLENGIVSLPWRRLFDVRIMIGAAGGSVLPGPHSLLDNAVHDDTVTNAPSQGSIIYGNATPEWDELLIGAAGRFLRSDGVDISWAVAPGGAANVQMPIAFSWMRC